MSGDTNDIDPTAQTAEVQGALNAAACANYRDRADDYDRHQTEDCLYASPENVARQVAEYTEGAVNVVDVGAGTGLVGEALLREEVDARLTGIDLVHAMHDQNESPAYTQRIIADATQRLPLRAASFDVAVSAGLMEHVIDLKGFLGEFVRVVKPGGIAVLTYVPNVRGRTIVFDRSGTLLSHDARQISTAIEHLPGAITDRRQFNAYKDDGKWIRQEAVTIECQ